MYDGSGRKVLSYVYTTLLQCNITNYNYYLGLKLQLLQFPPFLPELVGRRR